MTAPAVTFNTAALIVQRGMRHAGKLARGSEPSSEDYAEYLVTLNRLVNLWQTQGIKLFLLQDTSITLVASQAQYILGPGLGVDMSRPLELTEAYYKDSSGNVRPLIKAAWADWVLLPKASTNVGAVAQVFVDKQSSLWNVWMWPTPDTTAATGTAHLVLRTQATELVSITDATIFPQEWFMALEWGLADEICTGQPQAIMDRCEKRAAAYRTALENFDVEDAPTQFQPEIRVGSKFV